MMRWSRAGRVGSAVAGVGFAALVGCREGAPSNATPENPPQASRVKPLHFTDVSADSGLDAVMTCGRQPSREILEVNGGGLGLIDFDNDGDLDVFVAVGAALESPTAGPGSRLYENLGDLRFKDVTASAAINVRAWANGVAVGDFDGDRFDDIYIACYGPNILLRNNGNRTFSDVTDGAFFSPAHLRPASPTHPEWSTSAAFGDLDGDGDLDLYVCNYLEFDANNPPPRASYKGIEVMAGPHGLRPQHDVLYENLGDGTFRDVTAQAGCLPPAPAYGLNVLIVDMDGDHRQDIIVANDSMPDFYFRNLGPVDGQVRFEEIGVISGVASNIDGGNQASMGMAVADVDANGLPDKFVTVFSSDMNTLHLNIDGRLFEDRTQTYGLGLISRTFLGWSCGFYDFDHDGDEDLLMVNGHVYPQATREAMDSDYEQAPLLFERDGRRFKRLTGETAGAWVDAAHRDRNAVFDDLDGDGDIDVIIGELNGPIRVLRNDTNAPPGAKSQEPTTNGQQPTANWLIVELRDQRGGSKNHRSLGSKIELDAGGARQTRWLFTGGGFQSSGAPHAHFAWSAPAHELTLTVTWPDGFRQTQPVDAGRKVVSRAAQ